MPAKRRLALLTRRVLSDAELAEYLNKSSSWLAQHRHQLEAQYGFPKRLPLVGGNDLVAVDAWLDRMRTVGINISPSVDADDLWARATGQQANGKRKEVAN
jgi:hypothetical protein